MNRIVIDTNMVISFLTNRNLKQQELAAKLFEDASASKHEVLLHQIVASEVVYVLRNLYRRPVQEVAASVRDLIELPGVVVLDEMPWADLFDLWPRAVDTFADAALVAVMLSGKYDFLATFDRNLRNWAKVLGVCLYPLAR